MLRQFQFNIYQGLPLRREFWLRRDGARLALAGYTAELHVKPPGAAEIVWSQVNGRITLDTTLNQWTLFVDASETATFDWHKAPAYFLVRQPDDSPLPPVVGLAVTHILP
jgi:hypothetical protein